MSQFPYDSQSPYGYDSSQSANPYGYQQQPPMQNPYGPYAPGMPNPYAPWGSHPITGVPYSEKSKLVAGLLGIFLGYSSHLTRCRCVWCFLGYYPRFCCGGGMSCCIIFTGALE